MISRAAVLLSLIHKDRESLSYFFGGASGAVLNFLNVILIRQVYDNDGLGLYLLVVGAISLINALISLDCYRFNDKVGATCERNYIGVCFGVSTALFIPLALVLPCLVNTIKLTSEELMLVASSALMSTYNAAILVTLKNSKYYIENVFGDMVRFLSITFFSSVSAFTKIDLDFSIFELIFISYLISFFYLLVIFFFRRGKISIPSLSSFYDSVRYSIPYIPYSLANFVNSQLDKYVLAIFFDLSTVGAYGFVVTLMSPIKVVSNALSKKFSRVYFTSEMKRHDMRREFRNYRKSVFLFGVANYVLFFFGALIFELTSFESVVVASIFLGVFILRGEKQFYVVVNNKSGLSRYATFDFLIVTVFSTLSSLLLIPFFGTLGAGLATLMTTLLGAIWLKNRLVNLGVF